MALQQQQQDRIGWIGLGLLGFEMAQHLQKYLHAHQLPNLTVWNRTAEKAEKCHLFISAADGSRAKVNIIFTSLTNDAAVEQVYKTLLRCALNAQEQITFVETGTLYPELSLRLQKELASQPQHHIYLQCPVFGRPEAARAAQLVWIASGDQDAVDRLSPYLASMSQKILDLKTTDVSAASTLKLLGNSILITNTSILAESVNVARKSGLDPRHLVSFIDALVPAPLLMGYSRQLVEAEEDEAGVNMMIDISTKDMGCIRKWAKTKHAPTPIADVVHQNFVNAREKGHSNKWDFLVDSINSQGE
ncbi:hypothetical protein BGZ97_008795 [Linnemannia gamsii]|uniref:6-phosphogluconate dehydrogenase NADP-binding domain-containing protein n=1 Tax=Linnemannia gamsii TaxID=64522 RepID=A0A9P6RB86_9FUNG|nr:hypothetical protein BGZ97_008795 [Linnemannia gamsii]